ncbi:MAG: hypothetical protein Q9205_002300 [Flavoplaca limonia]
MGKELESTEQNPAELSTQHRDRTSRAAHLEAEASEHAEKVTGLEQTVEQLNAKIESMESSLQSLSANRQAALHAMMTFCIGHEISPEEITDDLTKKIVKGFSAPTVKIGAKLPPVTLAKPATSVRPAMRFWVSVLMGRENDVLEQAQVLFDTAAQTPIPIGWLEISTASLVERLEQWRNHVDLPTFVKLCLVAIQGMTVKRASANKSMKVAAWVQALLKEVPSQCLSFMCDQMATYWAATSLTEMEWLQQRFFLVFAHLGILVGLSPKRGFSQILII